MKYLAVFLLSFGLAMSAVADAPTPIPAASDGAQTLPVWEPKDADEIRFSVLRKGKPFGTHILSFSRDDTGALSVINDIDLTVKIGPMTAYKYRHDSAERWQDGKLISLIGKTRKEGRDLYVEAAASGEGLSITGSNFTGVLDAGIIPSSHWHSGEVASTGILSSEGGQRLEITTENLGRETLIIDGTQLEATKFKLVSDLTVFLWYDDTGRWVKCAFTARGQTIEYVLDALY